MKMSPKQPMMTIPDQAYHNNVFQTGGRGAKKGDNARYLKNALHLFNLPAIDLHDYDQVSERLNHYFSYMAENDVKPTVSGMGLALGLDRQRLYEINSGLSSTHKVVNDMPPDVRDLIKKAYEILGNLMEDYMQNGKVNPVAGIFLAKNHFGYVNETEVVVKPSQQALDSEYSVEEIQKRYEIPEKTDI